MLRSATRAVAHVREGPATDVWRVRARAASFDGPLLLDTHIWLWYVEGRETERHPATRTLLDRGATDTRLLVSDISFWEIATKAAKGKLTLSMPVATWLHRVQAAPGLRYLPIERDALVLSARLGPDMHGDPADRILVATARLLAVPLVTLDERIIAYASARAGVPVCDARR